MASEILTVPEEHLREVIEVIRAGHTASWESISNAREALTSWCDAEEEYLDDSDL